MFRVVTDFTPGPAFLMICDHHACGIGFTQPVSSEGAIVTAASDNSARLRAEKKAQFVEEAKKAGWLVSLGLQLCPGHHKAAAQPEQNRIVVPKMAMSQPN